MAEQEEEEESKIAPQRNVTRSQHVLVSHMLKWCVKDFEAASLTAHADARRGETAPPKCSFISGSKPPLHWRSGPEPLDWENKEQAPAFVTTHFSNVYHFFLLFFAVFFSARPTTFWFGLLIIGNATMLMLPVINHDCIRALMSRTQQTFHRPRFLL